MATMGREKCFVNFIRGAKSERLERRSTNPTLQPAAYLPESLLRMICLFPPHFPMQILSQMSTNFCGHPDWCCGRSYAAQRVAPHRRRNPNVLLRAVAFRSTVGATNKRKHNLASVRDRFCRMLLKLPRPATGRLRQRIMGDVVLHRGTGFTRSVKG